MSRTAASAPLDRPIRGPLHDIERHQNRSTIMFSLNEELARAHSQARLAEARALRAGHQVARARRLSRKAERAAQQARLALARAL